MSHCVSYKASHRISHCVSDCISCSLIQAELNSKSQQLQGGLQAQIGASIKQALHEEREAEAANINCASQALHKEKQAVPEPVLELGCFQVWGQLAAISMESPPSLNVIAPDVWDTTCDYMAREAGASNIAL